MWNEPTESELEKLPGLYATESKDTEDILIHMHFFLGGSDWYMAEYSPTDRLFFGYAILNNDFQNAEWGYTSYDELRDLKLRAAYEVERDLYWQVRQAREVQKIVQGEGW